MRGNTGHIKRQLTIAVKVTACGLLTRKSVSYARKDCILQKKNPRLDEV